MANPSQFYRSPLLSQMAMRWTNTGLIYTTLFPAVTVPRDVFFYLRFDQDVAYRGIDDRMAPHASANQLDVLATMVQASITDKAQKVPIDPKELRMGGTEYRLQQIKTMVLRDALGLAAENRAATVLRATATYPAGNSTTLAGVGQWSDYTNSDPKSAIMTAKRGLLIPSNAKTLLWMGKDVYDILQGHPKVVASVQYSQGSVDTRPILARYLQVDDIVVGESFIATSNMGQTLTTGRVWGKDAGLIVTDPGAAGGAGMTPTFGVLAQGNAAGDGVWRTYTWRDPDRGTEEGSTWVKVEGTYDFIVQASSLGFLWKNAVA